MRPVRVSDEALANIAIQTPRPRMGPAFDLLAQADDWHTETVADGPGRRLTRDRLTVAGYHLLVALDPLDPRPDALLVYRVDIWPDAWPNGPEELL